jgi:hypothetical protein
MFVKRKASKEDDSFSAFHVKSNPEKGGLSHGVKLGEFRENFVVRLVF